MANTAKSTKTTKPQEEVVEVNEQEELNLDKHVTVRSIANHTTGWPRVTSYGDVEIPPKGIARVSRSELIAQSHKNNKLINGVDGMGSHAWLIIEDTPTLEYLGFISDDRKKQLVASDELVEEVFAIKNQDKFEEAFKESFVHRAEWEYVMDAINRLGINDYNKIRFAEKATGFKVQ